MDTLIEVLGWVGAVLVLGAYALLSFHKIKANSFTYHAMNIGGSVFLATYAQFHGAIASVAVNVIWAAIGIYASYQIYTATTK